MTLPAAPTDRRTPPRAAGGQVHLSRGRQRRRLAVALLLVVTLAVAGRLALRSPAPGPPSGAAAGRPAPAGSAAGARRGATIGPVAWPAEGEAAYALGGRVVAGPGGDAVVPIASVAKVMTAYVVLTDHPLGAAEPGPTVTVSAAEAGDSAARRSRGESVVGLRAGERLTERQLLEGLLLPSGNDAATVLARWDAGDAAAFVGRENAAAGGLALRATTYTDASGVDPGTVSSAVDQTRLLATAMGLAAFAAIVGERSADLPGGTVRSTDTLLGPDGVRGGKTGSTRAAGGCFVGQAVRIVGGRPATVTAAVLGQPPPDLLMAGQTAAAALLRSIGDPPA